MTPREGDKGLNNRLKITATALVVGSLACSASSSDTRVARAHTFEFTADDAVQLIGPQPELPADPAVVQTVADLWIEYTLLAWALQEDTLFQQLDLNPIIDQQVQQELILELRDRPLRKKPATAELLVWLAVLSARGDLEPDDLDRRELAELPALAALVKDRDDLAEL